MWKRFLSCLVVVPALGTQPTLADDLNICSFNIQFLGQSTRRDNHALTQILRNFDIVVIQELVAPPFSGTFPDGTAFRPDPQAADFFNRMTALGFEFELSSEDTGTGANNHNNSSSTEWFVAFYKDNRVDIASDLPTEFLATDRTDHPDFERVPHSFGFRTNDDNLDFVLISVHLQPGSSGANAARRAHELGAIAQWVNSHNAIEKDFIILGDMNIEDLDELRAATPTGFRSLNDESVPTNTNVNGPKPYDHVMFRPRAGAEVDRGFDFRVFNLIEAMRPFWQGGFYPGGSINPIGLPAYDHDRFRAAFSDHHPVVFRMSIPDADDD